MRKELTLLREAMRRHGMDVYLIPTGDSHGSEYVGDHFKARAYVSGFTGSAGTLVVTMDDAGLWTDGRYFLQAGQQLEGSGIRLFRMGEKGVPKVLDYLRDVLKPGMVLGFNGDCVMQSFARKCAEAARRSGAGVASDADLVDEIWKDRPVRSCRRAWILPETYAGKSVRDKLAGIRETMEDAGADYLLLASLCDICWLLNVRGGDVRCTPVVLSYFLLSAKEAVWYVQDGCLDQEIRNTLEKSGVIVKDYDRIGQDLAGLPADSSLHMDPSFISARLVSRIPGHVTVIEGPDPTALAKAVKNPVEVENERIAHIRDGVAVTKFIYWLKTHVASEEITEISAAEYLEKLRQAQPHYVEASFDPIIAYGPHAALPHYSADETSNALLKSSGFVLADTGGHYLEGTTDITRTIVLGPLTDKEKEMFTDVLRGQIALSGASFLYGCTGRNLDGLARTPLWDQGLDYMHGTGHGVGYLLSVHEGPNSIRCLRTGNNEDECVFEEGMITSNEPGLYLEGEFGIRHENLMVCLKDRTKGSGNFMHFETLTMVPFDRAAILTDRMTEKELRWLNGYHRKVYETIGPLLTPEEKSWLARETAPLG
ncbi:MAG: aminopeptidase P family protein [Eubacterium sp.]|nr:aminopeptidase P family protein [Eubacterium sp.]